MAYDNEAGSISNFPVENATYSHVDADSFLHASIDSQTGLITIHPESNLVAGEKYQYTVHIVLGDGSEQTVTDSVQLERTRSEILSEITKVFYLENERGWANDLTDSYSIFSSTVLPGKEFQLSPVIQSTTDPDENAELVSALPDLNATVATDGTVTACIDNFPTEPTNYNFDSTEYNLANITVTFTFTDGSTNTADVHVRKMLDADADQYSAQFEVDQPNPVVAGQTYVSQPVWYDSEESSRLNRPNWHKCSAYLV